ncbi:hypothetical protein PVAP13_4NG107919 [Panicum virgatum]|uniref:Uncharacterized protein n=1 Tax=Panicum virgatum TaxID=38727 RepID=A0A8T0T7K3_PANVG|nr:hypothetical protein PVAP13_4NG107919 [Panicum virgatum]
MQGQHRTHFPRRSPGAARRGAHFTEIDLLSGSPLFLSWNAYVVGGELYFTPTPRGTPICGGCHLIMYIFLSFLICQYVKEFFVPKRYANNAHQKESRYLVLDILYKGLFY